MSARRTKVPAPRRVSDEEIVCWVSPARGRSPGEEARVVAQRIIWEDVNTLREKVRKLTLDA